jgi:Transcriptional regulator, AbiEi antitoxin
MIQLEASVAALAREQHGCFNRTQLATLGASHHHIARRVGAGAWLGLERGV